MQTTIDTIQKTIIIFMTTYHHQNLSNFASILRLGLSPKLILRVIRLPALIRNCNTLISYSTAPKATTVILAEEEDPAASSIFGLTLHGQWLPQRLCFSTALPQSVFATSDLEAHGCLHQRDRMKTKSVQHPALFALNEEWAVRLFALSTQIPLDDEPSGKSKPYREHLYCTSLLTGRYPWSLAYRRDILLVSLQGK